jgi:hypothetical protein
MILGLMVWMEQLDLFHNFGGKSSSFFECKDDVRCDVDDKALTYTCSTWYLVFY